MIALAADNLQSSGDEKYIKCFRFASTQRFYIVAKMAASGLSWRPDEKLLKRTLVSSGRQDDHTRVWRGVTHPKTPCEVHD